MLFTTNSDDADIKIADFGFARFIGDGTLNTPCGSPSYVGKNVITIDFFSSRNSKQTRLQERSRCLEFGSDILHFVSISSSSSDTSDCVVSLRFIMRIRKKSLHKFNEASLLSLILCGAKFQIQPKT